jgi:hypothetical protein
MSAVENALDSRACIPGTHNHRDLLLGVTSLIVELWVMNLLLG